MAKFLHAQRDFSAGELKIDALRRDDTDIVKSGCKVLLNAEVGQTGFATRRPAMVKKYPGTVLASPDVLLLEDGGVILLETGGDVMIEAQASFQRSDVYRIAKAIPAPGAPFDLKFLPGALVARNNATGETQTLTNCPWGEDDVMSLSYVSAPPNFFVASRNFRPQLFAYDKFAGTWFRRDFMFQRGQSGGLRQPFYRFSSLGVKIKVTGGRNAGAAVTVEFDYDVLSAGHVGTYFRYGGRQIIITGVDGPRKASAVAVEKLPSIHEISVDSVEAFEVGDQIESDDTGIKGTVLVVSDPAVKKIYVLLAETMSAAISGEYIVSPRGKSKTTAASVEVTGDYWTVIWDEQFMGGVRGWPGFVGHDRERLIFADFDQKPDAFIESAIASPEDFNMGSNATDAFFEVLPSGDRVVAVVGGFDQFVLSENQIAYIPISENNPLAPGSVAIRPLGSGGASRVRPVNTNRGVVFVSADSRRVMAIRATGQTAQPYVLDDASRYHSHQIKSPIDLGTRATGTHTTSETIYVVNADGSMSVGAYSTERDWIGFVPWTTSGKVLNLAADVEEIAFVVERAAYGAEVTRQIEVLNKDVRLDGAVLIGEAGAASPSLLQVNGADLEVNGETLDVSGAGLAEFYLQDAWVWKDDGASYGPLEVLQSGAAVDAEILTENAWVGYPFEFKITPFIANFDGGQAAGQRLNPRKINHWAVTVIDTQEFKVGGVSYAGWNMGEDDSLPQPLRSGTYNGRMLGRSHDPDFPITQEWPGAIRIAEIALEVTS